MQRSSFSTSSLRKMPSIKKQLGYSAPTIAFALLLATIAAKVGYVVAPAYYDNYLVKKALKDIAVKHEDRLVRIRKNEVSSELSKFYNLNGVRSDAIIEALEVDRRKDNTIIKVDYEIRKPFWGNSDVVLTFSNHLNSANPTECCKPSE